MRRGIEAYLEPKTSVTETTMLLVAGDGEWTRRRVPSAKAAADLARSLGIPLYDANRVGYPDRMREYNQRKAQRKTTTSGAGAPAGVPAGLSRDQLAALMVLERVAQGGPVGDDPSREAMTKLWKAARAKAHPDRNGGDRESWDKVEKAARTLGLH